MSKELKQKLSSRKFWAAVVGFITAVLTAFNTAPETIANVVAVISAFSTIIIYILAEAYIDKNRPKE